MSRVLPILFNTQMVQAIQEGRKTVTRRVIKPRYKDDEYAFEVITNMGTGERWLEKMDKEQMSFDNPRYINPPWQPGDILYVRETWEEWGGGYIYKAWKEPFPQPGCYPGTKWRPSIHMPRVAARIWLKVTAIRVERLQDITEEQATKEGFQDDTEYTVGNTARGHFIELWDSTIKKQELERYGWQANPWVWVIEFEQCEKPERSKGHRKCKWD